MIKKSVIVKNSSGLHARPAANFCKRAAKYPCDIKIRKDNLEYNAKSMLKVLSAGISKGTEIEIVCSGEEEEAALNSLLEELDKEE